MTIVEQITAEAARQGVDPNLALEVANAESGLDPNVGYSSAGAIGLFQLEPATAAQLGVNPRDPAQNIAGGIRYLGMMLAQFGSVPAALAAYNWGPGNLAKAISQWGAQWIAHLPAETSAYVAKITRNLGTLQQTVTITPSSIANGVTQLFSSGAPPSPGDTSTDGTTAPAGDHSIEAIVILLALGAGAYFLAEYLGD